MEQTTRGNWGSQMGFILAAAGSAIGLGNIWRYPYITGQNGGAAFVLLYLACVLVIALPVLIAELALGRRTTMNPVGAFQALTTSKYWPFVGYLGVITGVGILSFYLVVAGWTLGYIVKELTGTVGSFGDFVQDPISEIGYFAAFLGLTVFVVLGGVEKGIERWSKFLMPALLILLLCLIGYNLTLDGASKGIEFYLNPDFSKINGSTFLAALGQAFFSLSLGMGTMITYGSYLPKKENIPVGAVAVALSDTAIAFLAGLMIFPALFSVGLEPSQGPALVFNVLPSVFATMPGGQFIGIAFFILLAIAALTSTVSLLEVPVAFLVDQKKWSRKKAVWIISGATFLLGLPSALAQGTSDFFSTLTLFGQTGFLDIMSFVFSDLSLPIGGFFIAIFVGWVWGARKASEEILLGTPPAFSRLMVGWGFLIRFVCPAMILLVLIAKLFS
ncbi:MAG: Na+-dependent transporter [Ignavibacteria bacterium GWA2_55_25]|nr:MAG: Na+-dependent transporter [Ignavibacteria bacterium GWA2_55_25]